MIVQDYPHYRPIPQPTYVTWLKRLICLSGGLLGGWRARVGLWCRRGGVCEVGLLVD